MGKNAARSPDGWDTRTDHWRSGRDLVRLDRVGDLLSAGAFLTVADNTRATCDDPGRGHGLSCIGASGGKHPVRITVTVFRSVSALQLSVVRDSWCLVTWRHLLSPGRVQVARAATSSYCGPMSQPRSRASASRPRPPSTSLTSGLYAA